MAGTLLRFTGAMRGLRISWLTVGIKPSFYLKTRASTLFRAVSATFPYGNSGNKPPEAVLPEQNAEETATRFMQAGNV
jgi:hypothetical protein